MRFAFRIDPMPDECLGGLVARATAINFRRSIPTELRKVGVVTLHPQSLCSRSPELAESIAEFVGTADVASVAAKFHPKLIDDAAKIDFFGEPLRAFYRDGQRRRVSPRALKIGAWIRAMWSVRLFGFDPQTLEKLIDSCPVCGKPLGWKLTYGVAFCDHCYRPEEFAGSIWKYPRVDLRDFPQPLVEVDDIQALQFVTNLIDPAPGKKEAARRLVPELWNALSNGDIFEVVLHFASMQVAESWDKKRKGIRRRAKSGEGWDKFTPEVLAVAGRALIDGRAGLERFGDLLRSQSRDKLRERTYGWFSELGPLGITEPSLSAPARKFLSGVVAEYFECRRDPDMKPIAHLAKKYDIAPERLRALVNSDLVPVVRFDKLEKAPVLVSEKAFKPIAERKREVLSGRTAAPKIGVHLKDLEELEKIGLLVRVDGPVLKLLHPSVVYYTKSSVDDLATKISRNAFRRRDGNAVRMRVALRSLGVRSVPWAIIVAAIADGRLAVTTVKPSAKLLDARLAIRDVESLRSVIEAHPTEAPASAKWIGKFEAAELLGTNEVAVWRLAKVGKLKQYEDAPVNSPFKRAEIEELAKVTIFTPEIVRVGRFRTYREASTWLAQQGLDPVLELKKAGWKLYVRADVEKALDTRVRQLPKFKRKPPHPRAKGVFYGPESPEGREAATREARDPTRIGFATAASVLGCSIFAVQRMVAAGKLTAEGKVTPFERRHVEALAKTVIFLPEIMSRSGYKEYSSVMKWLNSNKVRPVLWLAKNGVPMFDRTTSEKILNRPISIGNAHPKETRRRLLASVESGSSIHQASRALDVPYATAQNWVRQQREGVKA
ncbi:hypothetical protein AB7M71_008711 [Bradyrhizobium japonicum]